MPAISAPCRSPVFILTASRSGSTLLRLILDSHPELACPPETSIARACALLARSWAVLEGGERASGQPATPSPEAVLAVREVVDRAYGRYLQRRGRRRWCDKSLGSYRNADLLRQIYPEAQFICLYRHCMDVIASGIEACPWGLRGFGFEPFAAQNPGNSVAAIGSYWLSATEAILAFEEKHPQSCHRARYEDLVGESEATTAAILSFLGVAEMPGITEACFRVPHESGGPGDDKVWFSAGITSASAGRGRSVPVAGLPSRVRQPVNDVLGRLGYQLVDAEWNAVVGSADPRVGSAADPADSRVGSAVGPAAAEPATQGDAMQAAIAAAAIAARIESRREQELCWISRQWPAMAGEWVSLVVRSATGERTLRLQFPRTEVRDTKHRVGTLAVESLDSMQQRDGGPDSGYRSQPIATIAATPSIWRSLLAGEANLITELTTGRLRCVYRNDPHRLRSDELHAIAAFLGTARIPATLVLPRVADSG